jgi:hypothetical protein
MKEFNTCLTGLGILKLIYSAVIILHDETQYI